MSFTVKLSPDFTLEHSNCVCVCVSVCTCVRLCVYIYVSAYEIKKNELDRAKYTFQIEREKKTHERLCASVPYMAGPGRFLVVLLISTEVAMDLFRCSLGMDHQSIALCF